MSKEEKFAETAQVRECFINVADLQGYHKFSGRAIMSMRVENSVESLIESQRKKIAAAVNEKIVEAFRAHFGFEYKEAFPSLFTSNGSCHGDIGVRSYYYDGEPFLTIYDRITIEGGAPGAKCNMEIKFEQL